MSQNNLSTTSLLNTHNHIEDQIRKLTLRISELENGNGKKKHNEVDQSEFVFTSLLSNQLEVC
jgi:hypothetical protein